jgi:hypothetical protein
LTEINAVAPPRGKVDVALPRTLSLQDPSQPHIMGPIARVICLTRTTGGGNGMIERVLSLAHSTIALGEKLDADACSDQRKVLAVLKNAILRLLRKAGDFFAAGGPLS